MVSHNNLYPHIYPKQVKEIVFLKHFIHNPNIMVGDYTYYHDHRYPEHFECNNVVGYYQCKLIIGKFCAIAKGTIFIADDVNHPMDGFSTYPFFIFEGWNNYTPTPNKGRSTIVGNDVWFGTNAVIIPGVTIGDGAIIGAYAVVTKDVPPYSIVAGNPSRIIKTKGYKDIKIISLLESESNKEDSKSKRSLADLIVEDEEHHKYIIEIERTVKDSFIHKACFNTARLIVDNLAQREDYTQIIKIFHISLLYFPIGSGNGTIYHGKTIIHEIESNERLTVHIKNKETHEIFDATNILPEYFYISVPLFNDRLEKEIDDWLHVLKYDEVPPTYHSPYMSQVAEKLNILKMTPEERANYSYYRKKLYNDRDELQGAEARGEAKAIKSIAKNLLKAGVSIDVICTSTGLSKSQIESLKDD